MEYQIYLLEYFFGMMPEIAAVSAESPQRAQSLLETFIKETDDIREAINLIGLDVGNLEIGNIYESGVKADREKVIVPGLDKKFIFMRLAPTFS